MSQELQTIREGNTLLIPIEIRASDQKKIDEMLAQLRELDAETKGLPGFDVSTMKGIDPTGEEAISKFDLNMKKWMERSGLDSVDVAQFMAMMKNPAAGLLRALMANPYVAAAMVAILIIPAIFDWMTDRGRPWNRFFVRRVHEEGIIGRSRESRQQVRFGFKQTIFVTRSGKANVLIAFNSYNAFKTGELEAIEAYQTRSGRLGP